MQRAFPKFSAHEAVVCFNCEKTISGGQPSPYATGQFVADCPHCGMHTFYDLTPEAVTFAEYGEFKCVCGNSPNAEGAYRCDREGNDVEPTPDDWPGDLYRCDRCGRIFDGDTGEVIGRKTESHV